jgi:hypothetical protein
MALDVREKSVSSHHARYAKGQENLDTHQAGTIIHCSLCLHPVAQVETFLYLMKLFSISHIRCQQFRKFLEYGKDI